MKGKTFLVRMPYVRIWTKKEVVIVPSKEILLKYFIDEQKELITLSTNIVKDSRAEVPPVYLSIKSALKSTFQEITSITGAVKLYVLKNKEILDKVKRMLSNEVKRLERLIKKPPTRDITELNGA